MTYGEMPTINFDDLSWTARRGLDENEDGVSFARRFSRGHKLYFWLDAPSDSAFETQRRLAQLAATGWKLVSFK